MEEMNEEQKQLAIKVLNMLGETIEDMDRIKIGKKGGIILQTGKPNIERFIKMAMEY